MTNEQIQSKVEMCMTVILRRYAALELLGIRYPDFFTEERVLKIRDSLYEGVNEIMVAIHKTQTPKEPFILTPKKDEA